MQDTPLRVLLIEDDSVDADLMRRTLCRSVGNYDVTWRPTIAEGLEIHQQEPFDAILTDLGLPGSTAMEAVATLSEACKVSDASNVAIVALSGQDREQLYIDAISNGAENFICKSDLTPTTIHRCIQQGIQRNIQRRENERLVRAVQQQKAVLEKQSGLLEQKNTHLKRLYDSTKDFVNNVSHEFRTPLCVVKQYANLIGDGVVGAVSEEQCRMLRVIEDRVDDLNNMVDDMLDISRHESGLLSAKRDVCRSDEIVTRLLAGLQQRAAIRNVQLRYVPDPTQAELYGDAEKISRTLINLIVNAIKFSEAEDVITISVLPCQEKREVKFSVADQGPGIKPEQQQQIFNRFNQVEAPLHQSIDGFGLGLSIAKELVGLNLGAMSLESEVGVGSTFSFTVPFNDPAEFVQRYFDRLSATDNQCEVSLLRVHAAESEISPAMQKEIHQLINFLIRSNDLSFQCEASTWEVILKADQEQVKLFIDRAMNEIESINRNRPQGMLPAIEFQLRGTYSVNKALAEELGMRQSQDFSAEESNSECLATHALSTGHVNV